MRKTQILETLEGLPEEFICSGNCRGIMEKPDVLKTMPEMGRRVPELGDPSIREILSGSTELSKST